MPPSVVLIARKDVTLKDLDDQLSPRFEKIDHLPDRLVVRFPSTYVAINDTPSVVEDYEPEELETVRALIPEPAFFLVEYHDSALLRTVLAVICESQHMLVDDDHVSILPCSDFVALRHREEGE